MNLFREKIAGWLSRIGPQRSLNQCFDLPVVLGTDIGLQRSENQDRVGALRINGEHPLIAVAVVDGMGGMRDGGVCATLALSSFFYALTANRNYDLRRRADVAISHANEEVFRFAKGKGGATLSAVLLGQDINPFIVNIGDSRIYAFGGGKKVERLTRDDSLAEAVGGHGRELLQFVGMGEGMQPHIRPISAGIQNLALTTDGIHFVESASLEAILAHTVELKSASERLTALARWWGAPDNASSAIVGLRSLEKHLGNSEDGGVQLWDPFGSLSVIWIKSEFQESAHNLERSPAPSESNVVGPPNTPRSSKRSERSKEKSHSKRVKKAKKSPPPKEDIQLEIQIEQSGNLGEPDENSQ